MVYKVKIFSFSEYELNEDNALISLQNKGWEICGPVLISESDWCMSKSIKIPLKHLHNCD